MAPNAHAGKISLPLMYFFISAIIAIIMHITPDTASPAAERTYSPLSCAMTGIAVAAEVANSAESIPNDAIFAYFSSVRLRIKFDFSLELKSCLAMTAPFFHIVSDKTKLRTGYVRS